MTAPGRSGILGYISLVLVTRLRDLAAPDFSKHWQCGPGLYVHCMYVRCATYYR